ncbi:MAG: glycosyltransferase family 39 protein [Nanoarchaeota archaeon]|nr:glycosyltransferase family 39 protein [Nanoarchaeota archaeon]
MRLTKTTLFVLLLVLLAFFLRLFSAQEMEIGTDEMIYSVIPLNIISAGRLSTVEQAPVYFYLVDIGYKLFGGMSLITSRLPSVVFGALAVIVIFLIALELFANKKAALWSAFFSAISGYAIRWNQEMDTTAFFFALLSVYFFIRALKGNSKQLYLATIFLALGVLVKPVVLLLVPAFALVYLMYGYTQQKGVLYKKENKLFLEKKGLTLIFSCILLSVIVVSPVLVYNVFVYKEKGFTDYYFSVFADVGNSPIYQGQEAESWSSARLLGVGREVVRNLFHLDAPLLFLGLLGIFFGWRKEKYGTAFLLLSLIPLWAYIGGMMGGANHFVWIPFVLAIFSGYGVVKLGELFSQKFSFRYFIPVVILVALISLFFVLQDISGRRDTSIAITLRDYARENFPDDAIVVLDPRIYRGIFAWAFPDKHYLEGTYFPELVNNIDQLPGGKISLPLYYVECGPGTNCGWKPEDFQRIYNTGEELSSFFRSNTEKIAEIKAIDTFIVYQGTLSAPLSIYEPIDRTHQFWYTPVGWKYSETAIDTYTPRTLFDKLLNGFGFFILYADVLLALLSLLLVFFLLGRQSD